MFHYFNTLTNTKGDSLVGYFCRVIDPATGSVVSIASDNNGTPILTTSGVVDMCKSDDAGNFSFYVTPGTYHLDIYAPDAATSYKRVSNVSMDDGNASAIAATAAATAASGSAGTAATQATTATTQAGIATAQASVATTQAGIATAQAALATTASIASHIYPNSAASAVPKGVTGTTGLTAGSGGTNGTFALAFSGGAGSGAAGTFTVAGGALTAASITATGYGYTSAPTISLAASSGLTGASLTAVVGFLEAGNYWAASSDGTVANLYQNNAGTPTIVSGAVLALAPSITALVNSLSETFTETVGRTTTPVTGNGSTNGTFLWADPFPTAATLTSVPFWAKATGTFGVGVYTKSGSNVTKVSSATFAVGATGLYTATATDFGVIAIPAGAYLALNAPTGGLATTSTSLADGSGWWGLSGTLPAGPSAVGTPTTSLRLEAGFVASYTQQTVSATTFDALAASVAANNASIVTNAASVTALNAKAANVRRSYFLKSFKPIAGVGASADSTFIMNATVPQSGRINELEIYATSAGTANVKFYSKSGNNYTLKGTISVTLATGYNYLKAANSDFTALDVTAGWYVAFYSLTGIVNYVSVGTNPAGFFAPSGDVGSFTSATAFGSSITPQIRISIDYTAVADVQALARSGGRFAAQVAALVGAGQSLNVSPATGTTTVAEYDNVGFPLAATSTTAIDFLPLTSANCDAGFESPLLEAPSAVKELIATENNLTWQQNDYQLLVCNAAVSSTTIATNGYGGTIFTNAMAMITAGKALAAKQLKTFTVGAVSYKQGEADRGATVAAYKAPFLQLASDYDTYGRAASGQTSRIPFLSYQTNTNASTPNFDIGQAQHEASLEHPLIHITTPYYFMTFYNSEHPDAASSDWLGDFDGLVYKRLVVDGGKWEHLYAKRADVSGATITLTYSPEGKLVFDTTTTPAQTNYGFTAQDSGGSAVTVSSVALIGSNRVRLTFASSAVAASVAKVGYGQNYMTGRSDTAVVGGGNLRDSLGDALKVRTRRMDRWAVLQQVTI